MALMINESEMIMKIFNNVEQLSRVYDILGEIMQCHRVPREAKFVPRTFRGFCQTLDWDTFKNNLPKYTGVGPYVCDMGRGKEQELEIRLQGVKSYFIKDVNKIREMETKTTEPEENFFDYIILAVAYYYAYGPSFYGSYSARFDSIIECALAFEKDTTLQGALMNLEKDEDEEDKMLNNFCSLVTGILEKRKGCQEDAESVLGKRKECQEDTESVASMSMR